jgi:hypothetical protein
MLSQLPADIFEKQAAELIQRRGLSQRSEEPQYYFRRCGHNVIRVPQMIVEDCARATLK